MVVRLRKIEFLAVLLLIGFLGTWHPLTNHSSFMQFAYIQYTLIVRSNGKASNFEVDKLPTDLSESDLNNEQDDPSEEPIIVGTTLVNSITG